MWTFVGGMLLVGILYELIGVVVKWVSDGMDP